MKNKFKIFAMLLALLLCFGAVAGCGNGDGDGDGDGGGTSVPDNVIVVGDKLPNSAGLNALIIEKQEAFEEAHPEIEVRHVAPYTPDAFAVIQGVTDYFSTYGAETSMYVEVPANDYARQLYYQGVTKEITTHFNNWSEKEDVKSEVLDGFTVNNKVVGFPTVVETPLIGFNKDILYSRRSELQAIGQDYQALDISTWAKYKEVCSVLNYGSGDDEVFGMGLFSTDYYQTYGVWSVANGCQSIVQGSDGRISIDYQDPSMVNTFDFLRQVKAESANGLNPSVPTTEYYSYMVNGKLASFTFYPTWNDWFNTMDMNPVDKIDVYNFPKGPDADGTINTNPVFSKGCVFYRGLSDKQVENLCLYLEYMYGEDTWSEKVQYAYDEMITMVEFPALGSVNLDLIYEDLDFRETNWSNAIRTSLNNPYVTLLNSTGYTVELQKSLRQLFEASSKTNIESMLETIEGATRRNWLDKYNSDIA